MIKPDEDALGRAFLDCHQGDLGTTVLIDRDDGLSEEYQPAICFTSFDEWAPHQQKALEHAKGRVLDVGCGVGRHSLYLQGKGCDVPGIDASPLAVEVCKLRGLRDVLKLNITQISSKLGSFDSVILLGNNFGIFGSFSRARWLLKRLHGMTSPDAKIVAESLDPYTTSNPVHLAYHERNRRRGRCGGQIRMRVRYGECKTRWFDWLLVSRDEMNELLQSTGWRVSEFVESDGPTYIAVLAKEPA